MSKNNKSYALRFSDKITLEGIEKFASKLMIKYETALKQETIGGYVSNVGIGVEIAISILNQELEKAREELLN